MKTVVLFINSVEIFSLKGAFLKQIIFNVGVYVKLSFCVLVVEDSNVM